jgi:hypothetical protein
MRLQNQVSDFRELQTFVFSLKKLFRTQSLHLCENTSLANLSQLGVIHVMRRIGCALQSCHTNSIFSFVM